MADKWYSKTLTTNQTFIATMDDLIAQLKRINARQEVVKKVDFFPSTTSSTIGDKVLYIYDNSVYVLNGNREWELYNEKPSYYTKSYIDSNIYSKDETNNKFQVKLVSSSNIKTINGESILGSGDLKIKVTADVDLDDYYTKSYIDTNYYTKANIDSKLSTINSSINSTNSEVSSLKSSLATTNSNVSNLTSTVNTINNNYASQSYVNTKIANLINSAPATLDTLGEIADAIEENQSTIELLNSAIGEKANKTDVYTKTYIDNIAMDANDRLIALEATTSNHTTQIEALQGETMEIDEELDTMVATLENKADKSYVDDAVSGIDLSNYYTKAQTEEYVSGIVGDINTVLDEINGEVV